MRPSRPTALLLGSVAIAIAGGIAYFLLGSRGPVPVAPQAAPSPSAPAPVETVAAPQPSAAPAREERGASSPAWKRFRERFGSELQADFLPDGRIAAIHGTVGRGSSAEGGFNPDDPQKAIARAKEVLAAVKDLLGVQPDWPLEEANSKGNSLSAQVHFQERHEGIPLEPYGNVTIELGQQGELLSLYSDYISDAKVTNSVAITAEEASLKALSSVKDSTTVPKAEGGSQILWVPMPMASRGEKVEARRAYEYYVQGRQVVIDASNGAVLIKRDRRNF